MLCLGAYDFRNKNVFLHTSKKVCLMDNLATVDIIMLGLVVLMTIWGTIQGIVKQAGDLLALVLGIVVANVTGPAATSWLIECTEYSLLTCQIASYMGLFLVVIIAVRIAVGFIKILTDKARLGWIDSLAGGAFAAFKIILLVSVLLNVAMILLKDNEIWTSPALTQSICYESVRDFAPFILHIIRG